MHIPGDLADRSLKGEPFLSRSQPLPVSLIVRNALALLLLITTIVLFWQPLAALYKLTQEQSHYSHLMLIPVVSLYVVYLNRKVILTSGQWSPWSGLIIVVLGAIAYWQAGRATTGVDYLSLATLGFVIVIIGVCLICYGMETCR